ncbi:Disease resistance protein [Quillaja saponaria]|uniref:Disease resistance protein n=1 Tax=Quillaja saponaria TaxID=32244 RepID=A0AAD7L5A2_QUISA|nr:Disease resistance protein [Quillaja saponaria]
MHDVLRDMSLWVACEHGSSSKFVVFDEDYSLSKWKEAERISLWNSSDWHSRLTDLYEQPFSPRVLTMIVRDAMLQKFSDGFFRIGQVIKVLDLSHNSKLMELPPVYSCKIRDLRWLAHAPCLQSLVIRYCYTLEEVVVEDHGAGEIQSVNWNTFASLETLELVNLNRLRSICTHALCFPCLKKVVVLHCPALEKLPFDSDSAKNSLEHIIGDYE